MPAPPTPRGRVDKGRAIFWVGSLAVISLLVALLLPAIPHSRSRRVPRCRVHLKSIGLALHNYHDTYGSLPPAVTYGPDGKAWHSWRVLLLPFIGKPNTEALYRAYDFGQPWDSPDNRRLLDEAMPEEYRCPEDEDAAPGTTSYVAVVGQGTLWPPRGVTSFGDVDDGSERTLMVVEMSDSGVPWTKPLDLRLDAMAFRVGTRQAGIRSRHENAAGVLFGDGMGRYLSTDTPPEAVKSLLLRDDGGPEDVP